MNELYGFLKECRQRLGAAPGFEVWRRINNVFNWLPLAARIDGSILCMHGGEGPATGRGGASLSCRPDACKTEILRQTELRWSCLFP